MSYRSYCCTIRPKNGLNVNLKINLLKYFKKQKYYCYAVEGKDQSEHLHAQIWYDEPKIKGDLTKQLKRLQEKYDPDWGPAAKKVLVMGVKIGYSDRFHEEYMLKEDTTGDFNPPPETSEYYPSIEEQEKVMAKAKAGDSYFHRLEEKFNLVKPEDYNENNHYVKKQIIGKFLYDLQFVDKSERVITDCKKIVQTVTALFRYIEGDKAYCKNYGISIKEQEAHIVYEDRKKEIEKELNLDIKNV